MHSKTKKAGGALLTAFVMGTISAAHASPMKTTGWTTQPIGHHTFCQAMPEECQRTTNSGPDQLTKAKWAAMNEINNLVNTSIIPRTDMQIWGVNELWSYPDTVGDCEDYVLLKKHLLIKKGFQPSNLLITVVRQPNGDGHAVLTVRTDSGDFILDNLRGKIADWRDTPYTYLKRQSIKHAGRWVGLADTRAKLSGLN